MPRSDPDERILQNRLKVSSRFFTDSLPQWEILRGCSIDMEAFTDVAYGDQISITMTLRSPTGGRVLSATQKGAILGNETQKTAMLDEFCANLWEAMQRSLQQLGEKGMTGLLPKPSGDYDDILDEDTSDVEEAFVQKIGALRKAIRDGMPVRRAREKLTRKERGMYLRLRAVYYANVAADPAYDPLDPKDDYRYVRLDQTKEASLVDPPDTEIDRSRRRIVEVPMGVEMPPPPRTRRAVVV